MKRPTALIAALLLASVAVADEAHQQVDFDLFDSAQAIGDGRIEPRPGEGETLLLQFWASWCHSCGTLMWDMDELVSRIDDLQYVAVSIDDDPMAARVYIRKHRLFEKYQDRYFVDSGKALSTSLAVNTVPTVMVINRHGQVLVRKSGHLNAADFQDIVTAVRVAE